MEVQWGGNCLKLRARLLGRLNSHLQGKGDKAQSVRWNIYPLTAEFLNAGGPRTSCLQAGPSISIRHGR